VNRVEPQKCFCGEPCCKGYIGGAKATTLRDVDTSDEEDGEDEEEEEVGESNDSSLI
jgi:hypothetical protein